MVLGTTGVLGQGSDLDFKDVICDYLGSQMAFPENTIRQGPIRSCV